MLIGGGTCSTAGGIKQIRIYLLRKMVSWELRRAILPQTAILERPIWEAERKAFMTDSRLGQVSVYVFLYCATFSVGTLILLSQGYSLHESLFEFASALGTVGLSIGVTSANTQDTVLWVQTAGMLLGRLEFFVIFISGYKIISDFKHMV
jgi:trk system potassium uptake protein TrkH